MELRKIEYTVSVNGITPSGEQFGGTQGDHRVTRLEFSISDELYAAIKTAAGGGKALYRFDVYDGEGGIWSSEAKEVSDTVVGIELEERHTRFGGKIMVYLVITVLSLSSETEVELFLFPANLYLKNRPDGVVQTGENYESISGLAEIANYNAERAAAYAVSAKAYGENARLAANEAENALENIKTEVNTALQEAKDSGEFDGADGADAITDQTYDPTSENAQSGKAVAEAIKDFDALALHNLKNGSGTGSLAQETCNAIGMHNVALGYKTTAKGYKAAFTGGYLTTAASENSMAIGQETMASGNNSFAGGYQTEASGSCAVTEGIYTIASGPVSHAGGNGTEASGSNSMAIGQETTASGNNSFAGGYQTEASGSCAVTEGIYTIASGPDSHAGGNGTEASGNNSFAFGAHTKATNQSAFAIGQNTEASGMDSFAGGYGSKATGYYTSAFGHYTIASAVGQTVVGKYNAEDSDAMFIVGNGDDTNNRSNAFAVYKDGTVKIGDTTVSEIVNKINNIGSSIRITKQLLQEGDSLTIPVDTLTIFLCNGGGQNARIISAVDGSSYDYYLGLVVATPYQEGLYEGNGHGQIFGLTSKPTMLNLLTAFNMEGLKMPQLENNRLGYYTIQNTSTESDIQIWIINLNTESDTSL